MCTYFDNQHYCFSLLMVYENENIKFYHSSRYIIGFNLIESLTSYQHSRQI